MSKENVKLFFEKIQTDEEMQKKLKNIYKEDSEDVQAKIVKLGTEAGYPFNEADVREVVDETNNRILQSEELDDTQLETVVGGKTAAWSALSEYEFTACLHSTVQDCDPEQFLYKLKRHRFKF